MPIDLDKLRDILTVKLKDLFSQCTQLDPTREAMLAELSKREQKKEIRNRKNHIYNV